MYAIRRTLTEYERNSRSMLMKHFIEFYRIILARSLLSIQHRCRSFDKREEKILIKKNSIKKSLPHTLASETIIQLLRNKRKKIR